MFYYAIYYLYFAYHQISKAFLSCFDNMVSGLQDSIGSVADKCLSRNLISDETYHGILQLNMTNSDKTRKLLMNVKETISRNSGAFAEFLDVLDESGFKQLVKTLKERLEDN